MDELTNIKIKAIALTIKQVTEERWDEMERFIPVFLNLTKKCKKELIDSMEKQCKELIPKDESVMINLYEYGTLYLKWLIFTDIYNMSLEPHEHTPENQ